MCTCYVESTVLDTGDPVVKRPVPSLPSGILGPHHSSSVYSTSSLSCNVGRSSKSSPGGPSLSGVRFTPTFLFSCVCIRALPNLYSKFSLFGWLAKNSRPSLYWLQPSYLSPCFPLHSPCSSHPWRDPSVFALIWFNLFRSSMYLKCPLRYLTHNRHPKKSYRIATDASMKLDYILLPKHTTLLISTPWLT